MAYIKKYKEVKEEAKEEIKFWVLSGNSIENWEKGIKDGIWGVREGLKKFWNKISKGDILIFYIGRPISGIIGFGRASTTFKQDKPLWPDEITVNKVIYPYRFEFIIEYCLPKELWGEKKISIRDLKIGFWAGLNPLTNIDAINKLNEKIAKLWGVSLPKGKAPISVKERKEEYIGDLHSRIKELLYEVGKIERYISEKEYPLDGERIDVVWRRVERGVPSRVFEVQIGGDIYHALGKLKHAFDLWNSDLFLIIKQEDRQRVETLLSGTFHEIKNKIKVISTDKVEELYELQMKDKNLKIEIGLI